MLLLQVIFIYSTITTMSITVQRNTHSLYKWGVLPETGLTVWNLFLRIAISILLIALMDDSRSAVCFCYHRVEWLTALNAWCVVEQLQVWCRQRKTSWRRWSEEVIRAAHHLTEHLHLGKLTQSLYYLVATRYSTPLCSLFLLLHISSLPTPSCLAHPDPVPSVN